MIQVNARKLQNKVNCLQYISMQLYEENYQKLKKAKTNRNSLKNNQLLKLILRKLKRKRFFVCYFVD